MTPQQCRQARESLGWTEVKLAAHAHKNPWTVMYFETGRGKSMRTTVSAIRAALEAAGIEFVAENRGGARYQAAESSPMTPAQCLHARELLSWSRTRLASYANCPPAAIISFELRRTGLTASTIQAIRTALEAEGIIFVEEDGDGPGVRLRKAAL